jgi:hypothetical protein
VGETDGAGLRPSAAFPSTAAALGRPPPIHLSSTGAAHPRTPLHPPDRPATRTAQGDIKDDPFYRLVFPTMDMLAPHHRATLLKARPHAHSLYAYADAYV